MIIIIIEKKNCNNGEKNKNSLFQRGWLHLMWLPLNNSELGYGLDRFERKHIHNNDI